MHTDVDLKKAVELGIKKLRLSDVNSMIGVNDVLFGRRKKFRYSYY